MALPIRTTIDDVQTVCSYLATKATGATIKQAKAVLDTRYLDSRKLVALRFWGLVEGDEKLKLTTRGREAVKNEGAKQHDILADVIREIEPYRAIVERVHHSGEDAITAVDVAAHWHEHFNGEVSDSDKVLNDQAVCFFQLASGAALGEVKIGRRGSPTRFEFDRGRVAAFVGVESSATPTPPPAPPEMEDAEELPDATDDAPEPTVDQPELGQAIFIGHGKNKKPLEQLKRILDQFKVPYKVAVDEPNLGRPIGEKVKETMLACNCAILIFTADEEFSDKDGGTIWRPSENVVYELGAAGYVYENRIVILKEDAVEFPSNFKDLGYIAFGKDQLEAKSMDVLKELIGFGILRVST